ncbi:MAG TPA: CUAEP/CCAEP-tail radical SAM protein, partial [Terriglobia bacterium]|nr:CUAEP/CCAEP-tail radical SAM protein [Terriglobia bacterium]
MNVLLISTYELGRQPFGLSSPAAWLRRAGHSVTCLDLSRRKLDVEVVRSAEFVAFFVPMHTATRLAVAALPEIRRLNPRARLCFYGLYAPVNESYLRSLGAQFILGGEFEEGLIAAVASLAESPSASGEEPAAVSLARQQFLIPDRA